MIRRFLYFFRQAANAARRSPMLGTATVGMLAVVFLLFDGYLLLALNLDRLAERWIGQVRLVVFLAPDTDPERAQELVLRLEEHPQVQSGVYVSKDEARERFRKDFPGDAEILEGLGENPLPASIELALSREALEPETLLSMKTEIEKLQGVEEAVFGRELFTRISGLVRFIHLAGLLFGLALVLAVIFLSANTIRLNLYSRREELEILQVVGATRWFIRWPFLIEGAMQGLFGAGASLLLAYGLYALAAAPAAAALSGPFGNIGPVFLSPGVCLLLLFSGAGLAGLGSLVAIGRFWRAI